MEIIPEVTDNQIKEIITKYPNLTVLEKNTVLIPMSKIRNQTSTTQEFRLNSNRIMRSLLEVSIAIN